MELFILSGIILFAFLGILHSHFIVEPREFNKGVCNCGNPLRHFDNDSQGGRGWKCDACGRTMWINGYADRGYLNPRITSVDYLHYPTYVANREGQHR
jgi:hypothetical protein